MATAIATIIIIGLLAYVAEQEIKEHSDVAKKVTLREKRFKIMLIQGYRSLSCCNSAEDCVKVTRGWVRRLIREFGDDQAHRQIIGLLQEAIFSKWKKYDVELSTKQ